MCDMPREVAFDFLGAFLGLLVVAWLQRKMRLMLL